MRSAVSKQKALQARLRVKKKKPEFVRQESWRYKRLKENWRRPKGIDNKIRRKIKGWPSTVNVGYRGPKPTRGLHPSGYEEVLVYNVEELKSIDPKTQAVRIAHTVGKRTRANIMAQARKKRIVILNLKETTEKVKGEKEKPEEEKTEEKEEKLEVEEEKPPEKPKSAARKAKKPGGGEKE